MEQSIKDKTVVITGGAGGIGYEIAKVMLKNEAKLVLILDMDETEGVQAADTFNEAFGENKAVFIKCDVTKDLDYVTAEIFKKYKVDVLINNAGIADETAFRKLMDVNVIGAIECAMKFWEHMRKDIGGHGGTIINTISIFGYRILPFNVCYIASKHAMMGFTRALGCCSNYKKFGVRVVGLCPGVTDTAMRHNAKMWPCFEQDFDNILPNTTFQTAEEVANAAIEVFGIAESGSAWVKEDSKPIRCLQFEN